MKSLFLTTVLVTLGTAVAQSLSSAFHLRLQSDDDPSLNGLYVAPHQRVFDGPAVFWTFTSWSPPDGRFEIDGDNLLKYTAYHTVETLASAGIYDSPNGVPVINLRADEAAAKGPSEGFFVDKSMHLNFSGFTEPFWVCDVEEYPGQTSRALTLWQYVVLIYPPPQETKGCKRVKVIAEVL